MTSFLTRLRPMIAALDDNALAALANKGLLRRAGKDIAETPPEIIETQADRLRIQVADSVVEVVDPPAKSSCSCPANGVCRHILGALLYLRENGPQENSSSADSEAEEQPRQPAPDPAAEIAALDDETLRKWAGKPTLRKAAQLLAEGLKTEIEADTTVIVRFPQRNVTCHWIPGAGLEGMVCSAKGKDADLLKAAAVLAFQAAAGQRTIAADETILQASAGAPRTRQEVLAAVGNLLAEMTSLGLSRLSSSFAQRSQTLSVSAHGVDLPRLKRMLQTLSDEMNLMLNRDAQAASANLLAIAARVEALRIALANPTPSLVGQHRTKYLEVGDLQLVGLGARRWRARSGFHGITIYFWDPAAKNWSTFSDAKPIEMPGFTPLSSYKAGGPWEGCPSPAAASRNVLRLSGSFRNAGGRLSGRPSTRAFIVEESVLLPGENSPLITDFRRLGEQAARNYGGGFIDRSEQDEIAAVAPSQWLPAQYNEIEQSLTRVVLDEGGRPLPLVLYYTKETEAAVQILEQFDPAEATAVLGLLRLRAGTLTLEPVAIHTAGGVLNLTLDDTGSVMQSSPGSTITSITAGEAEGEDAEDSEDEFSLAQSATPLGEFLAALLSEIEAIAEEGVAAPRNLETLKTLAAQAQRVGLTTCGQPVLRLIDALERVRKSMDADARPQAAACLLKSAYVVRLAGEQDAVYSATAALNS